MLNVPRSLALLHSLRIYNCVSFQIIFVLFSPSFSQCHHIILFIFAYLVSLFLSQFFRYYVRLFFYVFICPLMFQKQNMFQAHSHCSTLCSQSGNFEFKQFPLPFFYVCYRQTHKQQTNSIHMIKTDFCFQAVRSSNVRSFVLLDIRYSPSN